MKTTARHNSDLYATVIEVDDAEFVARNPRFVLNLRTREVLEVVGSRSATEIMVVRGVDSRPRVIAEGDFLEAEQP